MRDAGVIRYFFVTKPRRVVFSQSDRWIVKETVPQHKAEVGSAKLLWN